MAFRYIESILTHLHHEVDSFVNNIYFANSNWVFYIYNYIYNYSQLTCVILCYTLTFLYNQLILMETGKYFNRNKLWFVWWIMINDTDYGDTSLS